MSDRDYMQWQGGGNFRESFWSMYRGTKLIIVSLVVIHVLMAVVNMASPEAYNSIIDIFGLSKTGVLKGWIWQFVTCGLLHTKGILHLLFNCILLWVFGRLVEGRLNFKQYMTFCAMGVAGGSIFYVVGAVLFDTSGVAIGASGLVMALTVLAACWYPTTEIYLWGIFRLQLWVLAAVLVIIDLLGALDRNPSGVAYSAHLGGAFFGWLYYRYGNRIEGVFTKIDEAADRAAEKKKRKGVERELEVRREVDRILDKVNREGMTALTEEERKFLQNASKKFGG
ncbi:MAG: rhomboid family intramembrane serine protease [Planctomycetota bacterium]